MDNILNKIFTQLKNYIESNYKILNILQGDKVENEWKGDLLYAISKDEIDNWQNIINFGKISKELDKSGKFIITEEEIKILIEELENALNQ